MMLIAQWQYHRHRKLIRSAPVGRNVGGFGDVGFDDVGFDDVGGLDTIVDGCLEVGLRVLVGRIVVFTGMALTALVPESKAPCTVAG